MGRIVFDPSESPYWDVEAVDEGPGISETMAFAFHRNPLCYARSLFTHSSLPSLNRITLDRMLVRPNQTRSQSPSVPCLYFAA